MSLTARTQRGFTLVELIVSLGLFALVVLLASGAYLMMLDLNRQAQSVSVGIDNLSFAFDQMTRTISVMTRYECTLGGGPSSCPSSGSAVLYVTKQDGSVHQFQRVTLFGKGYIRYTYLGGLTDGPLTDTNLINVTSLTFYASGGVTGDAYQPYITIVVHGTVSSGPGKTQDVDVETSIAMRGTDI